MAKYFTLLMRYPDGLWGPEFGDYSRRVVKDELRDLHEGWQAIPLKNLRIVNTPDARQATIDALVREINDAEKSRPR